MTAYALVPKTAGDGEPATGKAQKGKHGGQSQGGKKQGGKMLQTGQSYKEAWKQRHAKGRRP